MKNENGIERSAILKGRTLVNLLEKPATENIGKDWRVQGSGNPTYEFNNDGSITLTANANGSMVLDYFNLSMFKPNTIYTLFIDVNWNDVGSTPRLEKPSTQTILLNNGLNIIKFISVSDLTLSNMCLRLGYAGGTKTGCEYTFNNIMVIEGDYTQEDIPYFEGMQSVGMPSLTTTGKNLFDGKIELGSLSVNTGEPTSATTEIRSKNFTPINGTPFVISRTDSSGSLALRYYDINKNYLGAGDGGIAGGATTKLFTPPTNARYVKFKAITTNLSQQIQIEYNTTATTYEPYKSNILTVNEDVALRGINDVQDTLDLTTGEVTERISEIVLNGSESWQKYRTMSDGSYNFVCNKIDKSAKSYGKIISNNLPVRTNVASGVGLYLNNGSSMLELSFNDLSTVEEVKNYLKNNNATLQYQLATPTVKTVDLTITDQDNQPQERMKLFPNGYINTSSLTFPPTLELKGITHNNKLNMTTTNGTNNTQLTTLDNLALDGIICRDGTIVRDSYDVESGLYTKRVFRFTIDEEFIERYGGRFVSNGTSTTCFEMYTNIVNNCNYPNASGIKGIASNIEWNTGGEINRIVLNNNLLYIRLLKEEVSSYDVNGILEWIKRNGAIEVAYAMATPQIIHMQPNMQPYVSTRPYQGEINSQGNALESSFLDYTQEESILSPKPLGEGDVLRWEQGSQCYVYENDKDYIPLTDYNQKVGTVLDPEDDEQFVENLDGGDIIVDVPFKEKAVYERELISYEDTVIYPTNTSADPDGKVEVDYICGATWQNPDDLSDIQHLGTLRVDGQYDVTIRRSGDDEIRLMNGVTNLSLDHEGLSPSEFELTYYNKDNVEVGKYGDTSHTLENTLVDGKLETGMVYGETMINLIDTTLFYNSSSTVTRDNDGWITVPGNGNYVSCRHTYQGNLKTDTLYTLIVDVKSNTCSGPLYLIDKNGGGNAESAFTIQSYYIASKATGRFIQTLTTKSDLSGVKCDFRGMLNNAAKTGESIVFRYMLLEGDYTSYPMSIPYFEGVSSTIVNGFTTTDKNLLDLTGKDFDNKNVAGTVCSLHNGIFTIKGLSRGSGGRTSLGNCNTFLFKKGRTYTFSLDVIENNATSVPSFHFSKYDDNSAYASATNGKSTTITPTEDVLAYIGYNVTLDAYYDCRVRVQIEEGTQATSYEPYRSIQYTLPTPITLNKVGDVVDTYDVVSGVENRKLDVKVFNGKNNFIKSSHYGQEGHTTFQISSVNSLYGWKTSGVGLSSSVPFVDKTQWNTYQGECIFYGGNLMLRLSNDKATTLDELDTYLKANPITFHAELDSPQTIQHTLIPSTVEMTQEPTFILPQPLRSVPNGICDRLYWDENKGHYCIEKRIGHTIVDGTNKAYNYVSNSDKFTLTGTNMLNIGTSQIPYGLAYSEGWRTISDSDMNKNPKAYPTPVVSCYNTTICAWVPNIAKSIASYTQYFTDNPTMVYHAINSEIIDLPHLNKKVELLTQPDALPIGYKAQHEKANPQLGLTIPYKQLNPPSQPQNLDFQMNKEDYVLTWNDVKEARQYNVILNDNIVATTKVPWYNTGEEIHGYILVEAQNEIADNLSKELYVKTVPKAPAQLTVAHNGLTDNYDFEISFIKSTSSLADRYTVQYRVDGGEWIIQDIPADEVDANVKVLWKFSVFEIKNQIEVWATATNDMGTNDILPLSTYYMTPTPQWTYRINSREVFLRWVDESPYDTQYKLRYQYKSDGIYRYAHFEGDKEEIGQLYEAVVALAEDDEVTLELCVISDRENLYCKPIKASKALDPNILPPKNFNYRWLSRGLIEFYWEDVYDVDLEYEAIVEHRLSGETTWIEDRRVFSATDTEGTGTVYRLQYQMEDLEEIRVKVRMKWAMNETEWSESLTTVFIPVEGNPPQWIRRTQTQEGLLVEWEAQEYIDSYHVYVKGDGVELQHLETRDNFIYVDIDYSNPIDIEIYEVSRFTGGIEAEPSDSMRFIPHQNKQQMINNIYHPDTLKYELEVNTVQKAQKVSYQINDINTTPDVRTREAMDVSISSPFIITYHPLEVDVHQKGVKSYGVAETHIKTLDVKTRETVEVLTFERITDKYGMDFTVYTPFASKYPVNLEINQVRIVCLGDSLTSGHPLYWAESGTGDVTASYPYQLAKRLKNQYEVINKGYGYFM